MNINLFLHKCKNKQFNSCTVESTDAFEVDDTFPHPGKVHVVFRGGMGGRDIQSGLWASWPLQCPPLPNGLLGGD